MSDASPTHDSATVRRVRRVPLWPLMLCGALAIGLAVGFGVGRPDLFTKPAAAGPRPSSPHDLRSILLDRGHHAATEGDLEEEAAINGVLAQEAILRVIAVHDAWMPRRDPGSRLFPESESKRRWNYRNTAADFFCFLFLAAEYTDQPSLPALRETMRAEALLAKPGELCQPVRWPSATPIRSSHRELMFGAAEYAKDGLIALYDATGDQQAYDRLLEVADLVMANSEELSRFGPVPCFRSEVNGDMLQVFSRLSVVADRDDYGEAAARIGDAAIQQMLAANHGLPAHKFDYSEDEIMEARAKLRDHGSEVIGGLSEVYALAVSRMDDPEWAARAGRWAEPLARMYELILEHAVNDAGLIVNALEPETRAHTDAGANDNWGYILSGVLLFTQAAERHGVLERGRERIDAMLARTDGIIRAVAATNGYPWEGPNQDGYADSVESAIYMAFHRPGAAQVLLPWIDDQIGIMFAMQKESGFVDGHYLDGNFMRTSLLYADLRTGGWSLSPMDPGTRVGMASDDEGNAVMVVETEGGYTGALGLRRPHPPLEAALPWDWPRMNSWPQWTRAESIQEVVGVSGASSVPSVEALVNGWDVSLPPGGRLVVRVRLDRAAER
jgi:hypothetical protein